MNTHTPMIVTLPPRWVTAKEFERAYANATLSNSNYDLTIIFPKECSVMLDAALRMLSLVSYMLNRKQSILLSFEDHNDGVMSYFNRLGFFDDIRTTPHLTIAPPLPAYSSAKLYKGYSSNIVEIKHVDIKERDASLPSRLAKVVADKTGIEKVAEYSIWNIFSELIDNILTHSESPVGGYAALQSYRSGKKIQVAVSDGGKGLFETLRPSLHRLGSTVANLSEKKLLLRMFQAGGLSCINDSKRGNGLCISAKNGMMLNASIDIRLAHSQFHLIPQLQSYEAQEADDNLPFLPGTHFCFTFEVDIS